MKIPPALAFLVLVVCANCSPGQTAQPVVLDSLISQLGADDWRVRDAAQTLIVAMGKDAQKPIEALAANAADPDVRKRAQDILRQIAANSILRPSLVSLDFQAASAKEVYEALFAQANARLTTAPGMLFEEVKVPVAIKLENVPFWQAMNALEDQTGLALESQGREIVLTQARHRRGPAYIKGPFMVIARGDGAAGMIPGLKVFVEPRFRVLNSASEAEIDEATDDDGNPVRRHGARLDPHLHGIGSNAFDVRLDGLRGPVGRVRGSIRAVVATHQDKVEIQGIAQARNVEKEVNGRRFLVNAVNPEPGSWFITVVAYNSDPPTSALLQMRASTVDAKGNALQLGSHGGGGGERRVDFHYEFKQGPACGPPAKLIMEIPTDKQEISIPFEFDQEDLKPKRGPMPPVRPREPVAPAG